MEIRDVPPEKGTPCWKFANVQLDERTLELSVAGQVVELERKPLEVLRHLLVHAGDVVSHDQLLDAVWPGRILSESVIKKVVSRLREALGDADHQIIKTVHGYGYRLLAPVEVEQPKATVVLAPDFALHTRAEARQCSVLIVDIAGTVSLRTQLGDSAASRRIRNLLEEIIAASRQHGGEFIKSYGDDVMAIFERQAAASAAWAAVAAQRLAQEAGLQLYAGFHCGEVEFRQTMGHPDAIGLTVNFAARLHKLTEGAPGRIFLAEDSMRALPDELRVLTSRYGMRDLKGIGQVSVWTLDWQDADTTTATVFSYEDEELGPAPALLLRHGDTEVRLQALQKSGLVGRGKDCVLRVPDPEPRVSSTHLLFEFAAGRWFVQDISRNGTWLRDGKTGEETRLPNCKQATLPRTGVLCLGRPFAEDAEGRFTLCFAITDGVSA
jgi:DNA-binding winged helix-turn-helix (wHTH) protein